MAKTIWKFQFQVSEFWGVEPLIIEMPKDAEFLCVQEQMGKPCIWVMVDPDAKKETRYFEIRGTGHSVGRVGKYLGTWQSTGGLLVWHLFEGYHRLLYPRRTTQE